MTQIISIHSFRRGVGKTHLAANLTVLFAQQGLRCGLIDAALFSPGLHILLNQGKINRTLNGALKGEYPLERAAVEIPLNLPGRLLLIPADASSFFEQPTPVYNIEWINQSLERLARLYSLDYIVIDNLAGFGESTLASLAIANTVLMALCPEPQDFQGTSVMVDVAQRLEVSRIYLAVNKLPVSYNAADVHTQVSQTYGTPVAGVLPYSDELAGIASHGIFCMQYAHTPLTKALKEMADCLIASHQ